MPKIDKPDVRLGFWIAVGFFLFGVVMAVLMWLLNKARGTAGKRGG